MILSFSVAQVTFADHPENPDAPDLNSFVTTESDANGAASDIQLFTNATVVFLSESSSGTVQMKIILGDYVPSAPNMYFNNNSNKLLLLLLYLHSISLMYSKNLPVLTP